MRRTATSELLKAAIRVDGRSLNRIARDAGMNTAILSRFVSGQRGMNASSFDRLVAALGYELRPRRRAA
jgi:hypothetical protein